MKTSNTIRLVIICALLCLGLIAGMGAMFWWVGGESVELKEAMQTIANEESMIQDQTKARSILENSADSRTELRQYVVQGDDGAVALLSDIDNVAAALGLELTTNTIEVEEQEGSINNLVMSFRIKGPETGVRRMLSLLETMPYASDIIRLDLNRIFEVETGTNSLDTSITIRFSMVAYD